MAGGEMDIDGFKATVPFDPEISMFRGEFLGMAMGRFLCGLRGGAGTAGTVVPQNLSRAMCGEWHRPSFARAGKARCRGNLNRWLRGAALCPAGHLPHKGGDRRLGRSACFHTRSGHRNRLWSSLHRSRKRSGVGARSISLLVGEMSGRTEGGIAGRGRQTGAKAATSTSASIPGRPYDHPPRHRQRRPRKV